MDKSTPKPVTRLLEAVARADEAGREKLWALIYDELHRLAQCELAGHAPKRSLQPTSLVHETYIRLVGDDHVE